MSNTKNKNSVNHDDTKKIISRLLYRRDVVRALYEKGFKEVAEKYRNCGCSFRVEVCSSDPSHAPKPIPIHCGNRFCEDCEHRESYRKQTRYLPALEALLTPNPDYPDYRLRKLCLTTPYEFHELDSASFKAKQLLFNEFLQVYFYPYFEKRGELSKAEKRRGRVDLKKHGIGGLRSAEFGERTKHLHWHSLIYSPYMPHEDIVRVWKQVTGGDCTVAYVDGIKARRSYDIEDVSDLLGAVKEIVKYATKFTELSPNDIPHLYEILKGNRRFQSFGILYGIELPDDAEMEHVCEECGLKREMVSVGEYVTLCERRNIPLSDEVAEAVERGNLHYFIQEPEISSGKPTRKARDALESTSPC